MKSIHDSLTNTQIQRIRFIATRFRIGGSKMMLGLSDRLSNSNRRTSNLKEIQDNIIWVVTVNQLEACRMTMTRQVSNLEKHYILIKPRNSIIFKITFNNTTFKKIEDLKVLNHKDHHCKGIMRFRKLDNNNGIDI